MKKYQEPQAHHWIALRLMKNYLVLTKKSNRDCFKTTLWLVEEVGEHAVYRMLVQLKQEEA
jgi:hypothetical protein